MSRVTTLISRMRSAKAAAPMTKGIPAVVTRAGLAREAGSSIGRATAREASPSSGRAEPATAPPAAAATSLSSSTCASTSTTLRPGPGKSGRAATPPHAEAVATRDKPAIHTTGVESMIRNLSAMIALALIFAASPRPAAAQQSATPRAPARVPVTVALVESALPGNESWVVQRRPDVSPADVILLRTTADAGQLAEAVRTLLVIRQADGDRPTVGRTLRIRPRQRHRGAAREIPWIPRVWADLRRAKPREVAGLGTVRAVDIWLPPQHRRAAAR